MSYIVCVWFVEVNLLLLLSSCWESSKRTQISNSHILSQPPPNKFRNQKHPNNRQPPPSGPFPLLQLEHTDKDQKKKTIIPNPILVQISTHPHKDIVNLKSRAKLQKPKSQDQPLFPVNSISWHWNPTKSTKPNKTHISEMLKPLSTNQVKLQGTVKKNQSPLHLREIYDRTFADNIAIVFSYPCCHPLNSIKTKLIAEKQRWRG